MKKIMRFGLVLCCFMCMSMFMFGCDKKEDVTADYPDEKVFETALVDGEDLEGKTVDIVVSNLETKSVYGYNIWAGEHLNFVSEKNPDVNIGDKVTAKVTEVKSVLGSWIISYEKIAVKED